jgi:S-adenosylmethionine-diacylgycerolhomoserine-N-methlytransferase
MDANIAAQNMDQMYRYQRYIYDISRRYYLLGRDPLIRGLNAKPGDTIVEVACGTARNLLHAADQYPSSRLYGIDVSRQMLDTARESIRFSPHEGRIRLAFGDAEVLDLQRPFNLASADRIFFSYALSMIPNWPQAVDRALAHLAPGGALHIVDFGPMLGLPAPIRGGILRWLGHFDVTPRVDLASICEELAADRNLTCTVLEGLRGYWISVVIRAN